MTRNAMRISTIRFRTTHRHAARRPAAIRCTMHFHAARRPAAALCLTRHRGATSCALVGVLLAATVLATPGVADPGSQDAPAGKVVPARMSLPDLRPIMAKVSTARALEFRADVPASTQEPEEFVRRTKADVD